MRGFPLAAIHKDAAGGLPRAAALSVLPEVAEARWRKLGISNRVLDIAVAEPGLERPRVVSRIRQCVATGMAEHVSMSLDLEASRLRRSLDHAAKPRC
jgi:hypothetical protein